MVARFVVFRDPLFFPPKLKMHPNDVMGRVDDVASKTVDVPFGKKEQQRE